VNCRKEPLQGFAHAFNLSGTRCSSRARQYRQTVSYDGHVFDERRIRIFRIGAKADEFQTATFKRGTISLVLGERLVEIGRLTFECGQAVGEIQARRTDDCVSEHLGFSRMGSLTVFLEKDNGDGSRPEAWGRIRKLPRRLRLCDGLGLGTREKSNCRSLTANGNGALRDDNA